jgi:hypothetical protein
MITQIRKFLNNTLDLTTIDADVKYRNFHRLSVIDCNQTFTKDRYIRELSTAKDIVLLNFYDHFKYDNLSTTIQTKCGASSTLQDISHVVNLFKDKKIILLTENYYTNDEFNIIGKPSNLQIITCPEKMYNRDISPYKDQEYIVNKRLDGIIRPHVICLNNNPRPHRVGLVLYLTHLQLNIDTIHVTFISKERWEENICYDTNTILSYLYPGSLLHDKLSSLVLSDIYKEFAVSIFPSDSSHQSNFVKKLLPVYETTVVEIVTETTSLERTTQLTEKFVHSVLGKCFPIIIGTYRNVELYRRMGYDMFDDIIDHSYDYEPNPFYRLKMAIDLNMDILTNQKMAASLYYENLQRFDNNIKNYNKQYSVILGNTIGDLDAVL